MASFAKCFSLAVILTATLATSFLVVFQFLDIHGENCKDGCAAATVFNFASVMSWFVAWEVGLFMLLHVCMRTEPGGYLPMQAGVLMYCLCSHAFFWIACILIGNQEELILPANSTASVLKATKKLQEEISHIYLSTAMLTAVITFTISSLALCGLMFVPKRQAESKQEIKVTTITNEKAKTEKPQNV